MTDALLLDIPPLFESERLLLRCPQAGDGPVVFESVRDTLAALRAWDASLPWARGEPSVEASERFCREGHLAWWGRTAFPLLVFLKDGGHHVGNTGVHAVDWQVPKGEIGYWCNRRFQGQGLMTEALMATAAFAFRVLDMRRVAVLTDEANAASRRVCERSGFTLEGVLKHERRAADGTPRDTCLYARLRQEVAVSGPAASAAEENAVA